MNMQIFKKIDSLRKIFSDPFRSKEKIERPAQSLSPEGLKEAEELLGKYIDENYKIHGKLKMYILVKETIPVGLAMAAVGHACVSCYDQFTSHGNQDMKNWKDWSFRKVVCKVTEKEFEKAKTYENRCVMTERNLAIENKESAIAFCPRPEWPYFFNSLKLWK